MKSIEFEHFWTPVLDISVDKNVAELLQDCGNLVSVTLGTDHRTGH